MDNQLKLPFGGMPPYEKTSVTSKQAADSVSTSACNMRTKVYNLVELAHEHGMTCDEVEEHTGMRHQSCSARIRELVLLGRLVDTGTSRKTRSGRNARVYATNLKRKYG